MPRTKTKLVRYSERTPLFARFELEPQIERIYDRQVALPSGGSIVIDRTEALVAIDVNSGRSTRASSQEETAHHTNLEAGAEVARQLRLRDIGGLIVIDFIDMRGQKQRRQVERALQAEMKPDRARVRVGKISPNGLLEVNRQRLSKALQLRTHQPCPTCDGVGIVATYEHTGLNLVRRIEARAAVGRLSSVVISLHPRVADGIQNSRRGELAKLEEEFGISIVIKTNPLLGHNGEEIDWIEAGASASSEAKWPGQRRLGPPAPQERAAQAPGAGRQGSAQARRQRSCR
jgi:ribonuclease E